MTTFVVALGVVNLLLLAVLVISVRALACALSVAGAQFSAALPALQAGQEAPVPQAQADDEPTLVRAREFMNAAAHAKLRGAA